MSDQPISSPHEDAPDAEQPDSVPTPEQLLPDGDRADAAGESPEVRQMADQALASGSQPRGKTAKTGSWLILAVLGLCLLVALVAILARMLR